MIDIMDIVAGESYACKYKVDEQEKFGLILQRDIDQKLVKLQDVSSSEQVIVPFDLIYDIDEVEWVDEHNEKL
jgi:hypothetical protein